MYISVLLHVSMYGFHPFSVRKWKERKKAGQTLALSLQSTVQYSTVQKQNRI